jgi:nucleoside phosphorylase
MQNDKTSRAVILTAIPVEFEAVLAHLEDPHLDDHGRVPYRRGTFLAPNQVWDVLIRETGPGNVSAALETSLAIHYFQPIILLFVGVAGGLKDVTIGDIVIPTKAYAYESGKANVDSFQTKPEMGSPAFLLEQVAQVQARGHDWLQRLKEGTLNRQPKVFVAPIASGDSVVASTRSAIYKFLRNSYSSAIAVDMESYGFFLASRFYPEIDVLAIRGISDLINNKYRTDKSGSQKLAANHASAFAFELLAKIDVANFQQKKHGIETANSLSINGNGRNDILYTITDGSEYKWIIDSMQVNIYQKEFLQLIRYFVHKTKELYIAFYELQTNLSDNCKAASGLMRSIEVNINGYYKNKINSRNMDFILGSLQSQIKDVINLLDHLSHIYLSGGRKSDLSALTKQICYKLDLLAEKLEQLEGSEQAEKGH